MYDLVEFDDQGSLLPSMLDDQYSLSFRKVVNHGRQSYMEVIRKAVEAALDTEEAKAELAPPQQGIRYVVDITPQIQEQIDKGLVRLDYGKDGQIYAQLRDTNNHFGKKLPIKEELIERNIDPLELRMAMQMAAIQQQLDRIADTLDEISIGVADVIKGQQNDRLGFYYSGVNLLLEAREVQDETMRKLVFAQALKSLSDATGQLTQAIQEDIRYLVDGQYNKKRGRREEIDRRMASIDKCFDAIHRAAVLKAAVYYDMGETSALLLAVEEYARFIDRAIAPHSNKLAEFDVTDKLLTGGKWESRVKALGGTAELRRMLATGTTFYLDVPKNESEGA